MSKLPIYQIRKFYCDSNENDLYVNDFKSHLQANAFIEATHSHNFYLLVLFTHGIGSHTIDFERFEITPGSLYFLKPGQVHSWQLSQDIDGYIAFYSQEIYNLYFGSKKLEDYSFYGTSSNTPQLVLAHEQLAQLQPYFDLLIREGKGQQTKKSDQLLNILDCIHIEIERWYESGQHHSTTTYHFKLNTLKHLVDRHYKDEKTPAFYAEKMNMSLKHLNRICKEVLNITATEFIYRRVILESKRLLSVKGMTVNAVATALGYENYSYFTKVFKKYTGQTPQHFRKGL